MRRPTMSPTAAAVAVTAVGMLPVYLLGGLAVQMRADLDIGRSTVGVLVAAFFAAAAVASVAAGRLADRLPTARLMRASAGVAVLALLAAALAAETGWLALALCVGGLASGAGQPASNTLISRAVPPHRRALAFGAKQAAIPMSVLLGGLAVPLFGVTVGWRWAYVAGALIAAVVAFGVPGTPPPLQVTPGPPGKVAGRTVADLRAAAAGPYRLLPLAVLALGATMAAGVGNAFGTFYVETAVASGLAPGAAGLSAAAASAVGIVVRVGIGAVADRRTARYLVIVAAMMSVGALAGGLLATGAPAAMVPAVLLAYGLGWAWAGLFTYAVTLTHPDDPGRATGVTQGGVSIGGALGPLSFGRLAEDVSLSVAWSATAGCALLAAATVLAGRAMLMRSRPGIAAVLRARRP